MDSPAAVVAEAAPPRAKRRTGGAMLVAAGIFFSKIVGLVRQRVFAHFFGNSIAAAAFQAAFRIPNFLQNLFGEGVLSASFIPVYSKLLGQGDTEEADRVAGAVFGLLSLATGVLVALGIWAAPWLVDIIAGGFHPSARVLAIELVRILFPAIGLLVYSAWCLGVLNSHRRFFLSYASPVILSVTQIAAMIAFGRGRSAERLSNVLAWSVVLGSALQFAIQIPTVRTLLGRFRPTLDATRASVKLVLHGFAPVLIGRGVVQLSAYVDTYYASLISERAFSTLAYAQLLYLLPISLFGMSVSAAELPEMSRAGGSAEEIAAKMRGRVDGGLRRIAFFVVPSAAAFLFLGDVVGGTILQTGHFHADDTRFLWYLMIGATVGLLASTCGRLYSSAFYALNDTKTPLYFSTARVALTAALAYWSVTQLPRLLGVPHELGAVGITATTGLCAWFEFLMLRRTLNRRIGKTGLTLRSVSGLWAAATLAGLAGLGIKLALVHHFGAAAMGDAWHGGVLPAPKMVPWVAGIVILAPFGILYFALTAAFGVPEGKALLRRLARR
jgi:putative peptidoglycan lipid II flippase